MICLINKRAAKAALLVAFFILLIKTTSAQKPLVVYYLKNSGELLPSVAGADYFVTINSPDSIIDKDLFVVKGYYPDGKLKYVGGTRATELKQLYPHSDMRFMVVLQGWYIEYYTSGLRIRRCSYTDGNKLGYEANYYPNGKLYCIKTYDERYNTLYEKCLDTAGNVLAENGNGKWIAYTNDSFKNSVAGNVAVGRQDGNWTGKLNDSISIGSRYDNGVLKTSYWMDKTGLKTYTAVDIVPVFKGGTHAFFRYMAQQTDYSGGAAPSKVVISFIVTEDGSLADLKVAQSAGKSFDNEVLRALKHSPKWNPGMVDGKPVRVGLSLPIQFSGSGN